MVVTSALARPLRTPREDPSRANPEEGDQSLQHRNRRLQEELAKARSRAASLEDELSRFVAKREKVYADKVTEANRRCERIVKEKEDAQAAWRQEQEHKLREVRAAATIMHQLWMSRTTKHRSERHAEQAEAQRQLSAAQAEARTLERDLQTARQEAQEELARRSREHQTQLEELMRKKAAVEESNASLEQQLLATRHDVERLIVKGATQQSEIDRLQQSLADAERREEILKNDTHVKALKERMQRERDRLEREVMDYVGYIVRTSESRPGTAPDFPWGCEAPLANNGARPPGRAHARLSPLPPANAYRAFSAPTPTRPDDGKDGKPFRYRRPVDGAVPSHHLSPLFPLEAPEE